ncbi:hypothetical protein WEH80_22225 [Actinomycetes bacterium KLBMP 9759]
MAFRTRRPTRGIWALAVLLVVACGAPEYTYVTNSDDRTYLRVPSSWQPIDERALAEAVGLDPAVENEDRGLWLEAYDADAAPSPDHLFGQHAAAPAVLVSVQDVPPARRGQLSLDALRDAFFPVSPTARQQLEASPFATLTDFALVADEVLTPGDGIRGVHSVFRYRMAGGPLQMINQTAYTNDDASKLYLFYVRCSTECYQQRQKEIENVVSSFTVREKP